MRPYRTLEDSYDDFADPRARRILETLPMRRHEEPPPIDAPPEIDETPSYDPARHDRSEETLNRAGREWVRDEPVRRYNTAREDYRRVVDERPRMKDHRGGVLRTILAGALGGAVGYANAGRRVRIDERPVQAFAEEMAHPGYRAARQDWEDREIAARSGVQDAESELKRARDEERIGLERQRTEAAMERDRAHGRYWDSKAASEGQPEEKKAQVVNSSNGIFEKLPDGTWKKVPGSDKPASPPERRIVKGHDPKTGEIVEKVYDAEGALLQTRNTGLTGPPSRAKGGGKGSGDGGRKQASPESFGAHQTKTDEAYAKGQRAFDKEAATIEADRKLTREQKESAKKQALDRWESEKRAIQRRYELGIEARGGSVAPREKSEPSGGTDQVKVRRADGTVGMIPRAQLEAAKKRGAVEVE